MFFYHLVKGVTGVLFLLTLLLEGALGSYLWEENFSEGSEEVIRLTMLMLPALWFICLYALNQSLLNCERSFFTPSAAPTLQNILWILAVVILWKTPAIEAMEWLARLVVLSFALQWIVTLPGVYRFLAKKLGSRWWVHTEKKRL